MRRLLLSLPLLTLSLAAAEHPSPALEAFTLSDPAAVASFRAARSAPDLTFEVRVRNVGNETRTEILSPAEVDRPRDFRKHFEKLDDFLEPGIWCDNVRTTIKPGTLLETERSEETAHYRFERTAADPDDNAEVKYSEVANGELFLRRANETWRLEEIRFRLSSPFKPFLFVSLPRLDITTNCAAASNGRMFKARTETIVEGSAMGVRLDEQTVIEISGLVLESN